MKNRVCTRQICFILVAYNAVLKMVVFPSVLADSAGADIVFPALFNLALQTAAVWAVAFVCSRTDKTFFVLLKDNFGEVAAKMIFVLFGLYFLFAAIVPMNEQQLLVHAAFYDTVPSLYIFLPFFFLSAYVGGKGLTNAGRCADICLPIFAVCIAVLLIFCVGEGDYSNLLPVLKTPTSRLARSSLAGAFRYSDAALLLLFMGKFTYRKGDAAKITLSYVLGGLIVVAFLAIFYAVYGNMAASRAFMLKDIAVFSPAVSYVGRVDLLLIYVLDIVMLFAVILHVQACVYCLCTAFSKVASWVFSLAANAVLLVLTFVLNNKFTLLQSAAGWFWIPTLIFAYILPFGALCLRKYNHEKDKT